MSDSTSHSNLRDLGGLTPGRTTLVQNKSPNKDKYDFEGLMLKGFNDSSSVIERDVKQSKGPESGSQYSSSGVNKTSAMQVDKTSAFNTVTKSDIKLHAAVSLDYQTPSVINNKLIPVKSHVALLQPNARISARELMNIRNVYNAFYSNNTFLKLQGKLKDSIFLVPFKDNYLLHLFDVTNEFNIESLREFLDYIRSEYGIDVVLVSLNNVAVYERYDTSLSRNIEEEDDLSINLYV